MKDEPQVRDDIKDIDVDVDESEELDTNVEENSDTLQEEKKEDVNKEAEESEDLRYLRLAADFQNFKRRVENEKKDIYNYANEKIALDILDVMDNFERALEHGDESEDQKLFEGVELIYKQLKGVLDKYNILEIKSDNEIFDPNFHNAVMMEKNDEFDSNIVINTIQKGYTLNGKVIRPSMVIVSQ